MASTRTSLDTADLALADLQAPLRIMACASRSEQGLRRIVNEDAALIAAPLLAVADGVGGQRAGERAAALAVDVLRRTVDVAVGDHASTLRESFVAAHQEIRRTAKESPLCAGMASTLVAAIVCSRSIVVAHVGDSRAYLLREGQAHQLTRDHSLVEELVANGSIARADAQTHPMRAVIVRALGADLGLDVDVRAITAVRGDVLLLCTDGLTDVVDVQSLAACPAADVGALVEHAVQAARRLGSGDDVTVVAARLG